MRGSDYIAPSEQTRVSSARVVPRILNGKSVSLLGPVDQPHTWTSPTDVAGVPHVKVSSLPGAMVGVPGVFNPAIREMGETSHQWDRPFVMDDSAARWTFGMEPTPWGEIVQGVVDAYR